MFYLTRMFSDKKFLLLIASNTAQKIKFSIKDFFSKCDQIRWCMCFLFAKALDITR